MDGLAEAFYILAGIFTVLVYASPGITFWIIHRARSTLGYDPTPYLLAYFSAILAIYAGCIIHDKVAISINSAGLLMEFIYVGICIVYPPCAHRLLARKLFLILTFAASVSIVATYFGIQGHMRDKTIVYISSVATLVSYLGTIYTTYRSFRERKNEDVSVIALTFFMFVAGGVRCAASLLAPKPDYVTAITSGIGSVMAIIQVQVYGLVAVINIRRVRQETEPIILTEIRVPTDPTSEIQPATDHGQSSDPTSEIQPATDHGQSSDPTSEIQPANDPRQSSEPRMDELRDLILDRFADIEDRAVRRDHSLRRYLSDMVREHLDTFLRALEARFPPPPPEA